MKNFHHVGVKKCKHDTIYTIFNFKMIPFESGNEFYQQFEFHKSKTFHVPGISLRVFYVFANTVKARKNLPKFFLFYELAQYSIDRIRTNSQLSKNS